MIHVNGDVLIIVHHAPAKLNVRHVILDFIKMLMAYAVNVKQEDVLLVGQTELVAQ